MYLGFFRIPGRGIIFDILMIPLIVYSLISWRRREVRDVNERFLIFSFSIFIIYFIIILVTSEMYLSEVTSLMNIRLIYPYILFYVTIVILRNRQQIIAAVKYFLFLSVVASLFSVIQSIHGLEPLFNPHGFYNIGHWGGQGNIMIGPFARVMLPTVYLVYIVFIGSIIYLYISNKFNYIILITVLLVSIIISFTRSFWLATAIALVLSVYLLLRTGQIKRITFNISIVLLLLFIGVTLFLISLDNPVSSSLSQRFLSIFSDIQNSSGTYGVRLMNLQRYLATWQSYGLLFGVDPFYIDRFGEPALSDVGFIYVLVTIGLTGLILLLLLWISGIVFSIGSIKKGVDAGNNQFLISGILLFASIVFFIICQVYTQYDFSSTLFSLIFGLSVALNRTVDA